MKVFRFFVITFFLFSSLFAEESTLLATKEEGYIDDVIHMITTLCLLLAFIVGALFFLKKMMRSRLNHLNQSTSIKILERRALHAKASLYLIEVLGKTIVISESQGNIQLITEISEQKIVPLEEISPKISFKQVLQTKFSELFKKS